MYSVTITGRDGVIATGRGRSRWQTTATRLWHRAGRHGRIALCACCSRGDKQTFYRVQFGSGGMLGGGTSLDDAVTVAVTYDA